MRYARRVFAASMGSRRRAYRRGGRIRPTARSCMPPFMYCRSAACSGRREAGRPPRMRAVRRIREFPHLRFMRAVMLTSATAGCPPVSRSDTGGLAGPAWRVLRHPIRLKQNQANWPEPSRTTHADRSSKVWRCPRRDARPAAHGRVVAVPDRPSRHGGLRDGGNRRGRCDRRRFARDPCGRRREPLPRSDCGSSSARPVDRGGRRRLCMRPDRSARRVLACAFGPATRRGRALLPRLARRIRHRARRDRCMHVRRSRRRLGRA